MSIRSQPGFFPVFPSHDRRPLELEQEGKNRKKLLEFFSKRLEQHTEQVAEAKGTGGDLEAQERIQAETLSTQLTDIVESDEEQVVLPQEVLNQL